MELALAMGKTLREMDAMDSPELTKWIAFTRYFHALPDSWRQNAMLLTAMVSPNMPKGKPRPKVDDFVPTTKPPQHAAQDLAAVIALAKALEEQQGDG